jgi:Cytochrome c oxidase subunit IV
MKTSWVLFGGIGVFYSIMATIYWSIGGDPAGVACLILSAGLALLVSFYVWFTQKKIGTTLPEDNLEAEIADGAGELGFYSPHSWWPLPVAAFAVLAGLGLIIGWWLTAIAVGLLVISIIGFVTEYEKPIPEASSHH